MTKFKVLSIDAWADNSECTDCGKSIEATTCECGGEMFTNWSWNNWFNHGKIEIKEGATDDEILKELYDEFLNGKLEDYILEDDQYNLVVKTKKDGRPIIAMVYGDKE